jgi:YVTN family beta-propeller protein
LHAWTMAVNEPASTLYVARVASSDLLVLDELSGRFTSVPTGAFPCAVAVNPVSNRAYVANYGDDSITIVDGAKRATIATVNVGRRPQSVAVDPKSGYVYVANSHSDDVSVIGATGNTVLKTPHVGKNPYALVIDPDRGHLYAATLGEPALAIIDLPR